MERWILGSGRCLFSNWSQLCTHNPTTHTRAHTHTHTHTRTHTHTHTHTHTFPHLLTLKTLIWHSNAADWQLRHTPLTDQTWFTMHACRVWVSGCECVILWGRDERRELGVRIVNLKVSHIVSFIYPAPPPSSPHTHTHIHTHTVSTRAPPSHSFQS